MMRPNTIVSSEKLMWLQLDLALQCCTSVRLGSLTCASPPLLSAAAQLQAAVSTCSHLSVPTSCCGMIVLKVEQKLKM